MRIKTVVAVIGCSIIFAYLRHQAILMERHGIERRLKGLRESGERVQRMCRALHGRDLNTTVSPLARTYGTLLVDHRHKLIYCLVPKVASSNVQRLFLVLGKHVNNTDLATITIPELIAHGNNLTVTLLATMSEYNIERYLKSYTKVVFTRNIFERLVSAYHSKIEIAGDEHSREVKRDIVESLKIESKLSVDNITVTFPDFIRYVLHLGDSKRFFDQHWANVEDLCDPCQVHYNYIGEYKHLTKQMNAVLTNAGVESSIRFPSRKATGYEPMRTAKERLPNYYQGVPYDHIRRLLELYSLENRLFNHDIPWPLKLMYYKQLRQDGVFIVE